MEQNTQHDHVRRKRTRRTSPGCAGALIYFIFVVGVSLIISSVVIFTANDFFALTKDDMDIAVTVTEPTKLSRLSKQLDKAGVINYGSVFKTYVNFSRKNTKIAAGTYSLNSSMDYGQIVRTLNKTDESTTTVTVTIPEGYTNEQIKQLLAEKNICSAEELDEALNTYAFKHDFLSDRLPASENWLEGYLFPDTYTLSENANAVRGVVNRMLNNFDVKYDNKIQEGQKELGLSIQEIVIVASMLEREAKVDDEFAKIAGVIYNRLNSSNYPYLQIDATVQYVVGHKDALTEADLNVDSPYNTYTHKGLPEGPICNPGYTALYAASHPEKHKYYYYVAMPDGSHIFSKTVEEHNTAVKKAKKAFEEEKNKSPQG